MNLHAIADGDDFREARTTNRDADAAIADTLETSIAPGRRVRISPLVEAMQFQLLFGESPDPARRQESACSILKKHQERVKGLAQCWHTFCGNGKKFRADDYDDSAFLDAYLAYYLTVNIGKLQLLFLDLLRRGRLPSRLRVVDVGMAAGTTFAALLDVIAAWESVCLLYGETCPLQTLELVGVDARASCIDYSRRAVGALAGQIASRSRLAFDAWAERADWLEHDLNRQPLEIVLDGPTLLVCSNVISELKKPGQEHLVQLIRRLDDGSIALLLEPGRQKNTRELNRWRKRLLSGDPTLHLVAPCGSEYGHNVPGQCAGCWNGRRESLHRPPLYRAFCQAATEVARKGNPKWQEEFENDLLSWSYLCFVRDPADEPPEMPAASDRERVTRYIGRFLRYSNENRYRPLAPDEAVQAQEIVKFCPADLDAMSSALTLARKPGQVLPNLAFGQAVRLKNIESLQLPYKSEYRVQANVMPLNDLSSATVFLPAYTESTRCGVDAVAHRLFGFERMHDFQHQILARVLTGHSIFGIAATGGGKSECYILPAFLLPGLTVVISPLKSLMQDQYDIRLCNRYGLGGLSTFINSSIPFQERENRLRRMELGYYKLVYLTPEQLARGPILDSLKRADERIGVRYLALDEAHCISHWGHDFRPSYLNMLARLRDRGIQPLRIALTATASPQVRQDICKELNLDEKPLAQGGDLLIHSANRPELNLIVRRVDTVQEKIADIEERLRRLLRENKDNERPGAALVFMPHTGSAEVSPRDYQGRERNFSQSRKVSHFASHLERALQTRVGIYHSKLDDEAEERPAADAGPAEPGALGEIKNRDRRSEQERFIDDKTDIMVATKGFGMGVDKANVRLVLHHTTPSNLEAYVQEAGRAGRDGELADVVLYFTPQPATEGRERKQTDRQVQQFFLENKYIRMEDLRAIFDFLQVRTKQPERGDWSDTFYFTADEVMGHFDNLAWQGKYSWPDFPERTRNSREAEEHCELLDLGQFYQDKVDLIDRILAACYRICPEAGGRKMTHARRMS